MGAQLIHQLRRILHPGYERHERADALTLHLVLLADDRRLRHRRMIHQGALHLHGAEPMAGNVHDVVHAAQQPEVAVLVALGAVARKVHARETAPVGFHVPVRIVEHGSQHGRPRPLEHQVAAAARRHRVALLVHHVRLDAGERLGGRGGLQGCDAGERCDQRVSGLGLPPRVHDRAFLVPDVLVVPHPCLGIDGLSHRTEEPQAAQVMGGRILGAPAHESADGRGRGMEGGHAVLLHHAPQPVLVRPVGRALVHHLRHPVGHGSVDDVRVPGDPADIRGAPEDIVLLHVEDPLVGEVNAQQVAGGGVDDALGLAGGAAGVEAEEHVFAVHVLGLAPKRRIGHQLVPPMVPALLHDSAGLAPHPLHHHHVLDGGRAFDGLIRVFLQGDDRTPPVTAVARDQHLGRGVVDAVAKGLGAEASEHNAVHRADTVARVHGDQELRHHAEVESHAVALPDPELLEHVGELVHLAPDVAVGQHPLVSGFPLPDDGGLVLARGLDVPVEAVIGNVDLPADEPLGPGAVPLQHLVPGFEPVQLLSHLRPESLGILLGLLEHGGVVQVCGLLEFVRRRESPSLFQQDFDCVVCHDASLTKAAGIREHQYPGRYGGADFGLQRSTDSKQRRSGWQQKSHGVGPNARAATPLPWRPWPFPRRWSRGLPWCRPSG